MRGLFSGSSRIKALRAIPDIVIFRKIPESIQFALAESNSIRITE